MTFFQCNSVILFLYANDCVSTDPDLNLQSFNDHGIFTVDELNELSFVVKPHLSAFHLNVRSLNRHFGELIELLDSIPFAFDFMAFSETWFT